MRRRPGEATRADHGAPGHPVPPEGRRREMSTPAASRTAAADPALPALVLAPPSGATSLLPGTPLLGLPLVRRTALAARRAGFGEVFWDGGTPDKELGAALDGTGVRVGTGSPEGAVRLPWNTVMTVATLVRLRESGQVGAAPVVHALADLGKAERFLLGSLVKEKDGFTARFINRKISLFISRLLSPTRVTPNQVTFVSLAIGLAAGLAFTSPRPAMQIAGALLFLAHAILDGCDGELARLKFLESRWGGVVDFWGDNVVHSAVFAGIAVSWSRSVGAAWPLALGALAVAGTLLSAGFVFHSTMRTAASRGGPLFRGVTKAPETTLSRMADHLAGRDFIYLVAILAFFGKAHWFLVMAAVGAPVFFLVLLAIARRGRLAEKAP